MHANSTGGWVPEARLIGALFAGALALILPLNAGHAATTISKCQIASGSDARLSVVYTAVGQGNQAEKQFDADLELTPVAYKKGQKVKFLVKGVEVASQRLKLDNNGDLEADVKLTTKKKKGKKAWPDNFPKVKTGTSVAAEIRGTTVLSCTLL
jgi:hypothetical protein